MILIVPACERGRGGGHLGRSVFLVRALREKGQEAFLWIQESRRDDVIQRFPEVFAPQGDRPEDTIQNLLLSRPEELSSKTWDFIVIDNFRTSTEDFAVWSGLPGGGTLIGIDEGGPCRSRFDFLLDLLPALPGPEPNLCAPFLLPLPKNRRPPKQSGTDKQKTISQTSHPLRILISFGAEDSANLGLATARVLSPQSPVPSPQSPFDITLIAPNSSTQVESQKEFPGINIIGKLPDLKEHLAEYDLFITHFGLGAFEAVYARVPVLLLSPTKYHERLARNAGFYQIKKEVLTKAQRHGGRTSSTRYFPFMKENLDTNFRDVLELRRREIANRFGLVDDQREDMG
ncbi:MAG: hypothetical protein FWC45_05255, partial [Treponema sp.]|nr:hypothetical protein [Treponema sp.]